MDEKPFNFLDDNTFDINICHSYHKQSNVNLQPKQYKNVYLVAWSYGIAAAEAFLAQKTVEITKSVAINGTSFIVNDLYGIPEKVFELTQKNLNTNSLQTFYNRMFHIRNQAARFSQNLPQRNIDDVVTELAYFANFENTGNSSIWDLAVVSEKDKIINTKNQLNHWQKHNTNIQSINDGHFPFYRWENWTEIIEP